MSGYPVRQFTEEKISEGRFLHQLSSFYCNIWRFDPNFGEYKQCPYCFKYYSYNQYEVQGVRNCPDPKCNNVPLVNAWEEQDVEKTILKLVGMKENFFGAVALLPDLSDTIIGFTWGYNRPLSEVYNAEVLKAVQNAYGYTPYFNEIASDPSFRQKGVGSSLCKILVEWMQRTSPNVPGYLHTHEKSPARRLFEKAGYSFLCYDEDMGDGRIFMSVNKCANLTPENL